MIELKTKADLAKERQDRYGALEDVLMIVKRYDMDLPVEDVLAMAEYLRNGSMEPLHARHREVIAALDAQSD